MTDQRPPLIIHHAPCTDGFTAAWVVHRYYQGKGREAELLGAAYGDDPPALEDIQGREVVIVDFSYPADVLLEIHAAAEWLMVLDHHKTAQENLKNLIGAEWLEFDTFRSGAGMAWDFFRQNNPRPPLVDYVEDRDIWKWGLSGSRAISAFIGIHDYDLQEWDALDNTLQNSFGEAIQAGKSILKRNQALVERIIVETEQLRTILGHKVPTCNTSVLQSDVCHQLLQENPDAPFAAAWHVRNDNYVKWSLRSEDGRVDVSEIARSFGGGGHRNAAGFTELGVAGLT